MKSISSKVFANKIYLKTIWHTTWVFWTWERVVTVEWNWSSLKGGLYRSFSWAVITLYHNCWYETFSFGPLGFLMDVYCCEHVMSCEAKQHEIQLHVGEFCSAKDGSGSVWNEMGRGTCVVSAFRFTHFNERSKMVSILAKPPLLPLYVDLWNSIASLLTTTCCCILLEMIV